MGKHIFQDVWDKCEFITTLDMIGVCRFLDVKRRDFNGKDINWLLRRRMPVKFSVKEIRNDGDIYIVTIVAKENQLQIQEGEPFVGRGDSAYTALLTAVLFLFQVIALRENDDPKENRHKTRKRLTLE